MEVTGPCLECDCEEFGRGGEAPGSHEQTMERIQAGLERVERMQEAVARLRAHANGGALNPER